MEGGPGLSDLGDPVHEFPLKQHTVDEISGPIWDTVVIGAGPAGAACALSLARSGHEVLLLDKERFPRHKTCGDMLIPDSLELLKSLRIYERIVHHAHRQRALKIVAPSGDSFAIPGEFWSLRRVELDYHLAHIAVEAGATFARGFVKNVSGWSTDQVEVALSDDGPSVKARFCVIATGAFVGIPRRLNMISRDKPSAVAMRCYVESSMEVTEPTLIYLESIAPGYAWIIPIGDGLFNVGCGVKLNTKAGRKANPRKMFETFMSDSQDARMLLERGRQVSEPVGAGLRCSLDGWTQAVKGRVICAGETLGTTLAFTGEGIGKALQSGKIAAEVIDFALASRSPEVIEMYERRLQRELEPHYKGYDAAEKWLSHPKLINYFARRYNESRYLQGQLTDIIEETGDPRRAFSIKAILRSYLG